MQASVLPHTFHCRTRQTIPQVPQKGGHVKATEVLGAHRPAAYRGQLPSARVMTRPTPRSARTSAGLGRDPFGDIDDFPRDVFDTRGLDESLRRMESSILETQRQAERQMEEMRKLSQEAAVEHRNDSSSFTTRSYESRSSHSYYYQSYTEFRSGPYSSVPTSTTGWSPALLGLALFLVGAYTAVAAAFNRGYEATKYSERPMIRWRLILLWPLLFLFSSKFRQEFRVAMQGRKTKQQQQQQPPPTVKP